MIDLAAMSAPNERASRHTPARGERRGACCARRVRAKELKTDTTTDTSTAGTSAGAVPRSNGSRCDTSPRDRDTPRPAPLSPDRSTAAAAPCLVQR